MSNAVNVDRKIQLTITVSPECAFIARTMADEMDLSLGEVFDMLMQAATHAAIRVDRQEKQRAVRPC
ncbi:MAG: hypothetical protein KGP14_07585 [Betaproteobacteria bacterium]|nr:hypothetical protein [Betaproteobacteria bacterium]